MPEWIIWVVVGVVCAGLLAALIAFLIKFFKMKPEERKELIIQILVGLVTVAEGLYEGSGRGPEKIAWVQEQFNKTAPWFVKLVLTLTKSADFNELVEKALERAKSTVFDKDRQIEE